MLIHIGDSVSFIPSNLSRDNNPVLGEVIFIHPKGYFYTARYKTGKGYLNETLYFSNAQLVAMIDAGLITGDRHAVTPLSPKLTAKQLDAILSSKKKEPKKTKTDNSECDSWIPDDEPEDAVKDDTESTPDEINETDMNRLDSLIYRALAEN